MNRLAVLFFTVFLSSAVLAKEPDCSPPTQYPAEMGHSQLNAAGLFDTKNVDFTKTTVERLSSEKIGPDLYRQVHDVRFFKRDGTVIEAITVGTVSSIECDGDQFDVYLVSHKIGLTPSEYDPSLDKKRKK